MSDSSKVEAPFSPPDIVWVKPSGSVPEGAIVCGNSNGEPVYAGRVYFQNELLIGSVDLAKNLCTFCDDEQQRESSDFEMMTVPVGEPLEWVKVEPDTTLKRRQLPNAGISKNQKVLYVGRITDGENSYIGSVNANEKLMYVAKEGEKATLDTFEILIHKHLEFLCICPPCPKPSCPR